MYFMEDRSDCLYSCMDFVGVTFVERFVNWNKG